MIAAKTLKWLKERQEIGILLAILILLVPYPLDNAKFILLPGLCLFFVLTNTTRSEENNIGMHPFFVCFLLFIGWSFISFFWSQDGSLVWNNIFTWISFLLMSFLISDIFRKSNSFQNHLMNLLVALFMFLLLFHLLAVSFNIQTGVEWVEFMSKNKNYTTSFLCCLYPFLLFYKSKSQFIRFLKIISAVLILNLILLTSARGALLALGFILLYKVYCSFKGSQYFISVFSAFSLVIISGIVAFNSNHPQLTKLDIVAEYKKELPSRLYLAKSSIHMALDNPVLGTGAGNWHLNAYNNPLADITEFNTTEGFATYRAHNLYGKILGELGIVGLLLFLFSFFMLVRDVSKQKELSTIQQASLAVLISYLTVSWFYVTANSHAFLFSGIQLLGFISIGILLSSLSANKMSRSLRHIITSLSVLAAIWFMYNKYACDKFIEGDKMKSKNELAESAKCLENLYIRGIKTSHGISSLIPLELAELYSKMGDNENAQLNYEKAIVLAPNNRELLYSYAQFLITENKDSATAQALLQKLLFVQSNHHAARELLDKLDN